MLESGKPSDIPLNEVRHILEKKGARIVRINRGSLVAPKPHDLTEFSGASKEEIEEKTLSDAVSKYNPDTEFLDESFADFLQAKFSGKDGIKTAKALLQTVEDEKRENEHKDDFENRIAREALATLGLGGD